MSPGGHESLCSDRQPKSLEVYTCSGTENQGHASVWYFRAWKLKALEVNTIFGQRTQSPGSVYNVTDLEIQAPGSVCYLWDLNTQGPGSVYDFGNWKLKALEVIIVHACTTIIVLARTIIIVHAPQSSYSETLIGNCNKNTIIIQWRVNQTRVESSVNKP